MSETLRTGTIFLKSAIVLLAHHVGHDRSIPHHIGGYPRWRRSKPICPACIILGLFPSNAPKRQAVLGESDVAHLPGDVAEPARRLSKPLGHRRLVEQPQRVVAGEVDLLYGQLKS